MRRKRVGGNTCGVLLKDLEGSSVRQQPQSLGKVVDATPEQVSLGMLDRSQDTRDRWFEEAARRSQQGRSTALERRAECLIVPLVGCESCAGMSGGFGAEVVTSGEVGQSLQASEKRYERASQLRVRREKPILWRELVQMTLHLIQNRQGRARRAGPPRVQWRTPFGRLHLARTLAQFRRRLPSSQAPE